MNSFRMMVPDPVELRMDMAVNGSGSDPVQTIVFQSENWCVRMRRKARKGIISCLILGSGLTPIKKKIWTLS